MTFATPSSASRAGSTLREAGRVADRAGGDDRALAGHQARHRCDRADAARVGERDVGALRRRRATACCRARRRPARRSARAKSAKSSSSASLDAPARPASACRPCARRPPPGPRLTCRGHDALRLAVVLREGVAHHRHVARGLHDRPGDQVGEGELLARRPSAPCGGASSASTGERAEARGGRDRAALVHEAGERGGRAADRLGLGAAGAGAAGAGAAAPLPATAASHVLLGHAPARAAARDRIRRRRRGRWPCGRPPGSRWRRRCRAAPAAGLVGRGLRRRRRRPAAAPAAPGVAAIRQSDACPPARSRPACTRISAIVPPRARAPRRRPCRWRSPRAASSTATVSPDLHRATRAPCPRPRSRPSRGRPRPRARAAPRPARASVARCRRRRCRRSRDAAARPSPPFTSISPSTVPPARSRRARRGSCASVPAAGEGTSASTLSVDTSTSGSSASTASPTCLSHSRTVPSVTDSPICGHGDLNRRRLVAIPIPRLYTRRRAS